MLLGLWNFFGKLPQHFHVRYLSVSGDLINSVHGLKIWTDFPMDANWNRMFTAGIERIPGVKTVIDGKLYSCGSTMTGLDTTLWAISDILDITEAKQYDKAMVNRIARATGHLKTVRNMVEEGRDCSEVLVQLAAVKSAINGAGKEMLKHYIETCLEEELEKQDGKGLEKLNKSIDSFMK